MSESYEIEKNSDPKEEIPEDNLYYSEPDDENPKSPKQSYSAMRMLWKVMSDPYEGWKNLLRSRISAEKMASGCFYPLLALASASDFAAVLYDSTLDISEVLVKAIITFMSYFLSLFGISIIAKRLPADGAGKLETPFGKVYVMALLSTLAIFHILLEILPIAEPVLVFLPLYTAYLLWRGIKFLRISESRLLMAAITSGCLVFGIPAAVNWILQQIMPSV